MTFTKSNTDRFTKRIAGYLANICYSILSLCIFFGCQQKNASSTVGITQDSVKLFQLMAQEHTGVTFTNLLKENAVVNYFNTKYIYNGGGVAIGDINNDGLSDLYFSSNVFSNELYLNKGNLQFENISKPAGVEASRGFKTGVAMADLNGDGWQDIFVCRSNHPDPASRSNFVYINNKDLTFTERAKEMGLADSAYSTQPHFLDFDRDGDVDIYLVNHPSDFESSIKVRVQLEKGNYKRKSAPDNPVNSDRLYRNNGDGTFTDVSKKAGIWNHAFGLSACIVDINNDDWPDVYVANDFVEPDFLYVNNKNGTFTESWADYFRHTASNSMGSDFADVDNDGLEDAIVVDMLPEDNEKQKQSSTTMILDRYEMLLRYGYKHQLMRNVLQRNNGNGTFSDVAQWAGVHATDWSWAPLFADFDNDGWKDLFISNGIRRDLTDLDYISFKQDSIVKSENLGLSYVTKDNFKQWVDRMPSRKIKNYIFQNQRNFSFANKTDEWGLTDVSFSNGAAYADLDNDGDLDLVVNNMDQNTFVYRNNTQEIHANNYLRIKLQNDNRSLVGTRLEIFTNGERQVSVLRTSRGYLSSVEDVIHFGVGKHKYIDSLFIYWPNGMCQREGRVEANQLITIIYAASTKTKKPVLQKTLFTQTQNVLAHQHKENDYNDFKSEFLLPHAFSRSGPCLTSADVNNDGLQDVYIGGAQNQPGALYTQLPNGTFKLNKHEIFEKHLYYEDTGATFFDADGDQDQDLYVVSGGNEKPIEDRAYQDRLYLNDGRGGFYFAADALPQESSSGSCVSAADYDRDGDLDLFVGGKIKPSHYPYPEKSYILQNNNGKFTDVTHQLNKTLSLDEIVTTAQWADVNGDGFPDLITAGEWSPIRIFINDVGKVFTDQTSTYGMDGTSGWWTKIVVADVNEDGKQDIIAGNWGKNIFVKASPDNPMSVYAKDFDNNGSIDPIICHYLQNKKWPLPRREILVSQIPSVKKKFVKFNGYAHATIETIFSPTELESALYKEVKILASCIFLNQGNSFHRNELPMDVQLSPVYAIEAGDFDSDGKLDILLAGNDFNPQIEEGICDAGNGAFLKGAGNGTFTSVKTNQSGFFAPGNVRSILSLPSSSGRRFIFVGNNNGPVEVFSISATTNSRIAERE